MNINSFYKRFLSALGDTTGARNIDEFQKKQLAAMSPASKASTLTATKSVAASESGKTFFLGVAGGFTTTLPAPAAGLKYRFVVSVAPTTAYIIVTNGSANIIKGGVNELEVDTGDDGPYDNDADTLTFVANVAVVGDWVDFESDGTSWFIRGQTNADGGITLTTAS